MLKRILVVDDHRIVREGIINSLTSSLKKTEFGEAATAAETIQSVINFRWDLVILDINMPGRDGLEVLKEIKDRHPEIPVIILSMHPEDQFAVKSLKSGASAYLTKDIPGKELANAIRTILKGERYLTPSIAGLIADEITGDHKTNCYDTLSNRERQVFQFIASGKNVTAIGKELNLSVKTISVYRSNILKKMGLGNNAEIMHYAFKNKLII